MIKTPITSKTITDEDTLALSEWLATYPRLTAGEQVQRFETKLAAYLGRKWAVMVNSGSSANLLALSAFKHLYEPEDPEVILPALSWSTDAAPIMQLGMEPVLVDCEDWTLHMDPNRLEMEIQNTNPACVLLVDVLGIPSIIPQRVKDLCHRYNIFLIEDCCESLGTVHNGYKTGTHGDLSTFSLYYSHQISSIEGGAVVTDDLIMYETLLSMRSHGWLRESPNLFNRVKEEYDLGDFEMQFTFGTPGYNLRSTDVNAYLGCLQLDRLTEVANKRNQNFNRLRQIISSAGGWAPHIRETDVACALGYPIHTYDREKALETLDKYGIESRPIIAGNLARQPFLKDRCRGYYATADKFHYGGFYIGCHQDMKEDDFYRIELFAKEHFDG